MAQIFRPSHNTIARASIVVGLAVVLGGVGLAYLFAGSPYQTGDNIIREQPVAFSHQHHVAGLGIDCRYCHTSVETSASAGIPPTYTCMSCHSQIWNQAPMLAPVRASLEQNTPIEWTRLHQLPDYAYFHHGIHIQKGIGCVECHGRVDKMPLMWKAESMTMSWCVDCHRHPEERMRKPTDVFVMDSPRLPVEEGLELLKSHNIPIDRLTNCSVCHR
jgi:hypothetical protein